MNVHPPERKWQPTGAARALWPPEYGAYAELGFPLLAGFLMGGVSVAGVGFGIAVMCGFLLNEPLSVLKGLRGRRALEELNAAARRRVAVLGVLGALGAAVAMILAPGAARAAALVPAAFAAALAPSVLWGKPKRLESELLMAAALAAMLPPVALAAGGNVARATTGAGAWFICFALATFAVHGIKARAKPELAAAWTVWVAPLLAAAVLATAVASAVAIPARAFAFLSVVPSALVVLGATILRVRPRRLKRVGWSLVAGNAVTLVLLNL